MRIALYEPDIPQNTGTILRTAACLDVGVDVIEPCGFIFGGKHMKRAGMDYLAQVDLVRHTSWGSFQAARGQRSGRLVLLTTQGAEPYLDFEFRADDTLLLGSESSGAPQSVHDASDARVYIPQVQGTRSLNVAVACAMVLGEALRQTR